MILILSEQSDKSTDHVIDWIEHLCDIEVLRINKEDRISSVQIIMDSDVEFTIRTGDKTINSKEIGAFWYRRGQLLYAVDNLFDNSIEKEISVPIIDHLNKEISSVYSFIYNHLSSIYHINSFQDNFINKAIVLNYAIQCGLKVPRTQIITNKNVIRESTQALITKSITEAISLTYQGSLYHASTERINVNHLSDEKMSMPSLVQTEIKKKFEVRTFYLNGDFYSMAIFSQNDERTRLDYRNYNFQKMNRMVPFILPTDIKLKISRLMNVIGINCGSIDLICDENGDFIFLEINPVGQFGMVSYPCNYYLEKQIAISLIKNHTINAQ